MKTSRSFRLVMFLSFFILLTFNFHTMYTAAEMVTKVERRNFNQVDPYLPPEVTKIDNTNSSPFLSGWLGPEIRISHESILDDQEDPAIAYNSSHGEFMVAWYNHRPFTQDITVQRINDQGELLSYFFVSTAASCRYPDLEYNLLNDNYLVVWSQFYDDPTPANDDRWQIWGRIINWNALGINTPFKIADWNYLTLEYPRVAYNIYHNQYLVVWQTSVASTGQLTGIGRRVLDASGGYVSNADYITGEGSLNQGSPDLDFNLAGDKYLVVWVEPGGSGLPNIFAGLLTYQGVLSGAKMAVDDYYKDYNHQRPAVATNHDDGFMVTWDILPPPDWDIYSRKILVDGSIDAIHYLFAIKADTDERNPAITSRNFPSGFLTVYQEATPSGESIQARRWLGNYPYRQVEVAPGGFGDNTDPAVAAGRPCYLVAYEWASWNPTYDKDIYGHLYCPDALFLPLLLR